MSLSTFKSLDYDIPNAGWQEGLEKHEWVSNGYSMR